MLFLSLHCVLEQTLQAGDPQVVHCEGPTLRPVVYLQATCGAWKCCLSYLTWVLRQSLVA